MFFDAEAPAEREIREPLTRSFGRADWQWALYGVSLRTPTAGRPRMWKSHDHPRRHPENGFISYRTRDTMNSLLMHVLDLARPPSRAAGVLPRVQKTYDWREYTESNTSTAVPCSFTRLSTGGSIRGIADEFMRAKGLDYFENSRRAVRVQQSSKRIRESFAVWTVRLGLSASDGPGPATKIIDQRHSGILDV